MLGTFIEKYYPYKKTYIDPILTAYEYFKDQLINNVSEAKKMLSNEDCPVSHLEKIKKINLDTPGTYLHSGIDGFISNESYDWLSDTLAGQTDQKCFNLDASILDIEYITEKVINPTIYLKKDIDFRFSDGIIIFKNIPGKKELFCHNVLISSKMYEDSFGFLFDNIQKELAILLLAMYRFGMTENLLLNFLNIFFHHKFLKKQETITDIVNQRVYTDSNVYTLIGLPNVEIGKTYNAYTPISKNVTVNDYKKENIYILDNEPITHNYVESILTWGSNNFGDSIYGNGNTIRDTYYRDKNVYVCNIYNSPGNVDSNKLKYLMECLPVWLEINVIVNICNSDVYENSSNSVNTEDAVYGSMTSKKMFDGTYFKVIYGYSSWGNSEWGGFDNQETCLLLNS